MFEILINEAAPGISFKSSSKKSENNKKEFKNTRE